MGKKADISIDKTLNKYKKRMKKICGCAVFNLIFGILCIVIGITMLVYFAKYWGDETQWRRGLGYFGVALLILALFILAAAVILFIIMKRIYDNLNRPPGQAANYHKARTYAYGEAPYPQQPPDSGQPPIQPPGIMPPADGATQPLKPPADMQPQSGSTQPSAPPPAGWNLSDVNVEVSDHAKF